MAVPESRSGRITRSMTNGTARVAASELLARALAATAINGDPSSYEEAMASLQREQWEMAIQEEHSSILRNDTFSVALGMRSPEKKPIGSKWVFETDGFLWWGTPSRDIIKCSISTPLYSPTTPDKINRTS